MYFMYRVLNDFDIECDPLLNGLASKKLIYDLTYSYLKTNESNFFNSLSLEEKDKYCKENMINYIKNHKHKIKKIIDKKGNQITEKLKKIDIYDAESWAYLLCYLSTLTTHLSNGSKTYTDWISASKDLNSISKYYKNQNTHKVAILSSCSNGVLDNNTIVIDLSSKKFIKDILPFISKKIKQDEINEFLLNINGQSILSNNIFDEDIFVPTSENFVGFNFSTYDKEVCIYRYYPSVNIISILETLQIELIELNLFNFDYLKLDKKEQIKQLNILKEKILKKVIEKNDTYLLHIYEELYLNNKNIELVRESIFDDNKIKQKKLEILSLATKIPNVQIKRR